MSAKTRSANGPLSRMGVRLWGIMMVLVLLSVAFMWLVQIFLFERNYVNSTIAELQGRIEPIMEDLSTEDLANNEKLLAYLSRSTNCKMMLVDGAGELFAMYSYGYRMDLEFAEQESLVWHSIKDGDAYESVLKGESYQKTIRENKRISAVELGIPVTYAGQPAFTILHYSLDELHNVLAFNRSQLVYLSLLLTGAAALLAAVFSRHFTRPIHRIKDTVDRLAGGDLEAKPGLQRADELGRLSDSVEELGVALQRVEVLRKEVIANVSHELRSPLALIIGYGEMVRDISWPDEAERERNMNLIIQEAKRMSEMVNDIMDYSQFQAGYVQLRRDNYQLGDIVESEAAHCEKSAAKHDIRIALRGTEGVLPVRVDALKLSQVLRNLLYNAINHTADGEEIEVSIERRGGSFRVAVANPGKPIPEAERGAIWERYHRSQHQGGRRQGTGLGLSIVSTILGAHGIPYGVDCADGMVAFWFDCAVEGDLEE